MKSARPLERIFERELARFVAVYPHLARVRAVITVTPRDRNPRSYAWCFLMRQEIWFIEKTLDLPVENVVALVRHELGHLAEPQNAREQHADDVAEKVTGERIRYDGNDVQTTGPGAYPRPKYLPR